MIQRFDEKWELDADGCHIWKAAKNPKGYGHFSDNKTWQAHIWIFVQFHGFQPDQVMHHCDKPACVRISCLKPGDQKANMAEMAAKGRSRPWPGESNPSAKLTADQVENIRASYMPRVVTAQALADKYGISLSHTWRIIRGTNWT